MITNKQFDTFFTETLAHDVPYCVSINGIIIHSGKKWHYDKDKIYFYIYGSPVLSIPKVFLRYAVLQREIWVFKFEISKSLDSYGAMV